MVVHETVDKTSEWKPQTQHPLFAWCPVQLQWLYVFFKLAKIKVEFGAFKLINIEIKSLKITARSFYLLFCLYFCDVSIFNITVKNSTHRQTKQNTRW